MSTGLHEALAAEHPHHPLGPDPDCPSCNPALLARPVHQNASPPSPEHPNVPGSFVGAPATDSARTSSSSPLQFEPTRRITPYEDCPKCLGRKPCGPGAHAPHYSPAKGGLVDCVGDLIPTEPSGAA